MRKTKVFIAAAIGKANFQCLCLVYKVDHL
jgi:hypothetical protein